MDGKLTQEELDALLNTMNTDAGSSNNGLLAPDELDAIGEIANICAGSSATSLSSILNQRVNITTPEVLLVSVEDIIDKTKQPCVTVKINYIDGIEGSNIQILQEEDVKVITDLMLGGDGSNTSALGDELTDLHMSALCEAMNQMTGASATSLYTMLNRKIDISPPIANIVDLREKAAFDDLFGVMSGGKYVAVCFKLEVGDIVDSSMMQLYTVEFAKELYKLFEANASEQDNNSKNNDALKSDSSTNNANENSNTVQQNDTQANEQMSMYGQPQASGQTSIYGQPQFNGQPQPNVLPQSNGQPIPNGQMPFYGQTQGFNQQIGFEQNPQNGQLAYGRPSDNALVNNRMNIQPAEFNVFDSSISALDVHEQIDLIGDVSLEITVELGKTQKTVKEILDFEPGTLVELDRLAGEMMDIMVNGKTVARGEIVVLEDKFAVQLKEIDTDKMTEKSNQII